MENTILEEVLNKINEHERDSRIQFFEEDHKYIVDHEPSVKYTSVTTWVHDHFEKFEADKIIKKMMSGPNWKEGYKYWNMTPDEIKALWNSNKKAVSGAGTNLHFQIECFYNNPHLPSGYTNEDLYNYYMSNTTNTNDTSIEWSYFINFVREHPHLKPYRTEWVVFNEDIKISGSIDMVYENSDGTLSIYDWKRCKSILRTNSFSKYALPICICHLPDTNFWHYTLQLNTYKYILETKYGKTIKDLYLVRLHPDAEEKNYDLIRLPIFKKEIQDLIEERLKYIK